MALDLDDDDFDLPFELRRDKSLELLADSNDIQVWGLVLVAAWPPEPLRAAYMKFVEELRKNPSMDSAYLYPFESLHLSIATAHPFNRTAPHTEALKRETIQEWRDIVNTAKASPEWPKDSIMVRCCRGEMHESAAVLRWEDTNGAVSKMRKLISHEVHARAPHLVKRGIEVRSAHIPDIIHSTVLRWKEIPQEDAKKVRADFEKLAATVFGAGIDVVSDDIKLVLETRPYMHVDQSAARFVWRTRGQPELHAPEADERLAGAKTSGAAGNRPSMEASAPYTPESNCDLAFSPSSLQWRAPSSSPGKSSHGKGFFSWFEGHK